MPIQGSSGSQSPQRKNSNDLERETVALIAEFSASRPTTVKELTNYVEKLMKTVLKQNAKIAELEEKAMSRENTTGAVLMSSLFDKKSTDAEVHILAKVRKENNEIERIKKNMIVSGLLAVGGNDEEKLAHDKAGIEGLVTTLGVPKERIIKHQRIITNNDKSNLILVEFDSSTTRDTALKAASKLRGNNIYNQIYINRDMTKAERVVEKQLRDERNKRNAALEEKDSGGRPRGRYQNKLFYWGIRFGELRRIFEKQA